MHSKDAAPAEFNILWLGEEFDEEAGLKPPPWDGEVEHVDYPAHGRDSLSEVRREP